jgi:hypothetical protein
MLGDILSSVKLLLMQIFNKFQFLKKKLFCLFNLLGAKLYDEFIKGGRELVMNS